MNFIPISGEVLEEDWVAIDAYARNNGIKKKKIVRDAVGDWVRHNIGR